MRVCPDGIKTTPCLHEPSAEPKKTSATFLLFVYVSEVVAGEKGGGRQERVLICTPTLSSNNFYLGGVGEIHVKLVIVVHHVLRSGNDSEVVAHIN